MSIPSSFHSFLLWILLSILCRARHGHASSVSKPSSYHYSLSYYVLCCASWHATKLDTASMPFLLLLLIQHAPCIVCLPSMPAMCSCIELSVSGWTRSKDLGQDGGTDRNRITWTDDDETGFQTGSMWWETWDIRFSCLHLRQPGEEGDTCLPATTCTSLGDCSSLREGFCTCCTAAFLFGLSRRENELSSMFFLPFSMPYAASAIFSLCQLFAHITCNYRARNNSISIGSKEKEQEKEPSLEQIQTGYRQWGRGRGRHHISAIAHLPARLFSSSPSARPLPATTSPPSSISLLPALYIFTRLPCLYICSAPPPTTTLYLTTTIACCKRGKHSAVAGWRGCGWQHACTCLLCMQHLHASCLYGTMPCAFSACRLCMCSHMPATTYYKT